MTAEGSSDTGPPDGWGEDELTTFIDMARANAYASFHNLPRPYAILREVDRGFLSIIVGWTDPENGKAAPLAIRAHSALRASAQLAMCGQLPEAFMVMRGCLECALYANHIDASPDAWDIWTKRGEGEKARKRCAREFAGPNLFGSLRNRNARLADIANALYERTIEFGAHPNELAVAVSTEMTETDDGHSFAFSYLSGDGPSYQLCHKSVIQTGLVTLDILCLVFPIRCKTTQIEAKLAPIKVQF